MDNRAAFYSDSVQCLLKKWQVDPVFRYTYQPESNGIVERSHCIIKRMAVRSNADILDMTFWYNVTPKNSTDREMMPSLQMFMYLWRLPGLETAAELGVGGSGDLSVGDSIFVKLPATRCTSIWPASVMINVISDQKLEVNGVPHHVSDIRKTLQEDEEADKEDTGNRYEVEETTAGCPQQEQYRPDFFRNIYDT